MRGSSATATGPPHDAPVDLAHDLPNVTILPPGEPAFVDATFDLTDKAPYEYFATTTVGWP